MKKALTILASKTSFSLRELTVFFEISQSIINTLDYKEILQIISDGIAELLDIESAAIYIREGQEEIYLSATTPPLDPKLPDIFRRAVLPDHPHINKAVTTLKPIVISDTKFAKLTEAEKRIVEARNLRSLLYLPFIYEDEVFAILILGTCIKPHTFTEHELEIGQMIASQLAMPIQNARLHSDLQIHKENLEALVEDRTIDLKNANEELQLINEELYEKNELVQKQKEELEEALNELKSIQVKLIQVEKMASLGVLTAGVAHEINNPLNFMMGAYEGFNSFFNEVAPEYKKDVDILLEGLKSGIERATDIVKGLSQFSHESEHYDEECNIKAILENCLLMLKNQYKERIQIERKYEKSDLLIQGNIGQLHQVFTNILLNAMQAIEGEGRIRVLTQDTGSAALITISDTGMGIDEHLLTKVIDPFFTTKAPSDGPGLGLSIAYSIIKQHKGQLELKSEKQKGTSVIVSLPK